jgi:hypothetical protein
LGKGGLLLDETAVRMDLIINSINIPNVRASKMHNNALLTGLASIGFLLVPGGDFLLELYVRYLPTLDPNEVFVINSLFIIVGISLMLITILKSINDKMKTH